MKAYDLVARALRLIHVWGASDEPNPSEAADALRALNALLDSWAAESLLVYRLTSAATPLVAGKSRYTVGLAGDITTTAQPAWIEAVQVRAQTVGNLPVDLPPLTIATPEEWQAIAVKGLTGPWPQRWRPERLGNQWAIDVWPVPSGQPSATLVVWYPDPIGRVPSLEADLVLPPGYEDALVYSLAERVAPEYGREPTETVVRIAREARASIKRLQQRYQVPVLRPDVPAGRALGGAGRYNPYTDSWRR